MANACSPSQIDLRYALHSNTMHVLVSTHEAWSHFVLKKDVSSAVHSMEGWFSAPEGVDLYLSLLYLKCLAALSTHL